MMSNKAYGKLVKKESDKSPLLIDCIKAFCVGGAICTLGQGLIELYEYLNFGSENARILTSVSLVFLGILLTALRVYDDIAKHAGAGPLVPITGFANSVASPAIEFKTEGFVTGLGVKMFVIAGPVIVYGVTASVVYGIIYYIMNLMAQTG